MMNVFVRDSERNLIGQVTGRFGRKQDNSPQRQLAPKKTRPKTTRPTFRRQIAPHSENNSPHVVLMSYYFAFSGIYTPTIPPRHMETCQCKPYLQERRQDKPIQLSACVLDLYFISNNLDTYSRFHVSSLSILSEVASCNISLGTTFYTNYNMVFAKDVVVNPSL